MTVPRKRRRSNQKVRASKGSAAPSRVLVIEDDPVQSALIAQLVLEVDPRARVTESASECHALETIGRVAGERPIPSLAIVDMMLPWAQPSPNMPNRPKKVVEEGYALAGSRVVSAMRAHKNMRDVPVLLVSVIERDPLLVIDRNVRFVKKASSRAVLRQAIRNALNRNKN